MLPRPSPRGSATEAGAAAAALAGARGGACWSKRPIFFGTRAAARRLEDVLFARTRPGECVRAQHRGAARVTELCRAVRTGVSIDRVHCARVHACAHAGARARSRRGAQRHLALRRPRRRPWGARWASRRAWWPRRRAWRARWAWRARRAGRFRRWRPWRAGRPRRPRRARRAWWVSTRALPHRLGAPPPDVGGWGRRERWRRWRRRWRRPARRACDGRVLHRRALLLRRRAWRAWARPGPVRSRRTAERRPERWRAAHHRPAHHRPTRRQHALAEGVLGQPALDSRQAQVLAVVAAHIGLVLETRVVLLPHRRRVVCQVRCGAKEEAEGGVPERAPTRSRRRVGARASAPRAREAKGAAGGRRGVGASASQHTQLTRNVAHSAASSAVRRRPRGARVRARDPHGRGRRPSGARFAAAAAAAAARCAHAQSQ